VGGHIRIWRKLKNELYNLCSSPNITGMIKSCRMRWEGHVACVTVNIQLYGVLVRNAKLKRLLGRPRFIWEDNIKMDLKQIGLYAVYWIYPARDRDQWRALVNTVMDIRVPKIAGNIMAS
jgi:hypothetical protein